MGELDMVTAMIRWFLLITATAATVAVFYMVAAMAEWPFGAASVYLIAASALGCLAVTFVWYIRSRYSKPSGGFELRLDRVDSTNASSRRSQDYEVPARTGAGERAATSEPIEDVTHRIAHPDDHDPGPLFEQRPTDADSVPLEEDAVYQALSSDNGGSAPSSEQIRVEEESQPLASAETSHVPLERLSPPAPSAPDEANVGNAGSDAKRLAEALNLYERIDRSICDPYGADHVPGSRGLWDELVEDYGAASIDLRDTESSGCRITLSSGNLVFYAPHRGCWIWVTFDRTEPTPSSPIDASLSTHIVTNPN